MEATQHEKIMKATPQRQHEWLQQLVGDWSYEAVAEEPGKPPERASGSEHVRSIGDIWFIAEGEGEMPGGGPATTCMTLGYDPQKARFVGTWIGSMMHHMWVYDGALDAAEKVLTLESEGPDFSVPGRLRNYRDVIEFKNADHRVLTSHALGDDGDWHQFMRADYRRKK
jgi:hypothetical protein